MTTNSRIMLHVVTQRLNTESGLGVNLHRWEKNTALNNIELTCIYSILVIRKKKKHGRLCSRLVVMSFIVSSPLSKRLFGDHPPPRQEVCLLLEFTFIILIPPSHLTDWPPLGFVHFDRMVQKEHADDEPCTNFGIKLMWSCVPHLCILPRHHSYCLHLLSFEQWSDCRDRFL